MKSLAKRIFYDPTKARIFYDFFAVLSVSISCFLIFAIFKNEYAKPLEYFYAPLTVALNYILGLYTHKKISSLILKLEILTISSLGAFAIISILTNSFSPVLFLLSIFSILLLYLPRVFLNFHILSYGNVPLQTVIKAHSPILVVGGGGYIGSHVVEKLLSKGYSVKVFDKFLYGRNVLKDLEQNPKLEVIEGDITNIFELTLALQNTQAVIHLAGIVGDPASALDPTVTRHMNITSTRILKDNAKAFKIPRFIFASSCSVYGFADDLVSEKSPTNPLSLYAQSKIDSENEILRETADFFHPTVLRFATVFGHSRRPRFDLVANLFTAKGFFKEDITVFNSDQWRPLIHTKDIANAIVMTLEAPIEKVSRQIFNVGDDRMNYTISEIASMAQEIAAKDHKISVHHKDFAEDKRNYKVSFEKINKVLHFQSSVDLREGMEEMYNNFAKKVYKKHYSDSIYSNLEMTKFIKSEFYSEKYKKSHVTDFDLTNPSYATS